MVSELESWKDLARLAAQLIHPDDQQRIALIDGYQYGAHDGADLEASSYDITTQCYPEPAFHAEDSSVNP